MNWPVPKNLKALRDFLGLTSYQRKFIKHYGQLAAPLTALLKKDAFAWNATADEAFQQLLVSAMGHPFVLSLPNFTKEFMLECDASGIEIGAILMQKKQPIAFRSQALKDRNLLLSTYEKQLLALAVAVKKWTGDLISLAVHL